MSQQSTYQKLRGHLAYLQLRAAAEAVPGELERASKEGWSPTAFLERLLEIEVVATEHRRLAGRLRFANFPAPWRLGDLDFDAQPALDRKLVAELASLRFLEEAGNVLLIGPPGVGKTVLAIILGRLAVGAARHLSHDGPGAYSVFAVTDPIDATVDLLNAGSPKQRAARGPVPGAAVVRRRERPRRSRSQSGLALSPVAGPLDRKESRSRNAAESSASVRAPEACYHASCPWRTLRLQTRRANQR